MKRVEKTTNDSQIISHSMYFISAHLVTDENGACAKLSCIIHINMLWLQAQFQIIPGIILESVASQYSSFHSIILVSSDIRTKQSPRTKRAHLYVKATSCIIHINMLWLQAQFQIIPGIILESVASQYSSFHSIILVSSDIRTKQSPRTKRAHLYVKATCKNYSARDNQLTWSFIMAVKLTIDGWSQTVSSPSYTNGKIAKQRVFPNPVGRT
jgi:hypothetical protein